MGYTTAGPSCAESNGMSADHEASGYGATGLQGQAWVTATLLFEARTKDRAALSETGARDGSASNRYEDAVRGRRVGGVALRVD